MKERSQYAGECCFRSWHGEKKLVKTSKKTGEYLDNAEIRKDRTFLARKSEPATAEACTAWLRTYWKR